MVAGSVMDEKGKAIGTVTPRLHEHPEPSIAEHIASQISTVQRRYPSNGNGGLYRLTGGIIIPVGHINIF
jgi:hypothetical protein